MIQFQNFFCEINSQNILTRLVLIQSVLLKVLFQMKCYNSDIIFMLFMNVLNKPVLNGYSSNKGTICILIHSHKIGRSDSAKVQDLV